MNFRTQFPADRKPYTGDHDYDTDSDLDEDEGWNFSDDGDPTSTRLVSENPTGKRDEFDSSMLVGSQHLDAKGDRS